MKLIPTLSQSSTAHIVDLRHRDAEPQRAAGHFCPGQRLGSRPPRPRVKIERPGSSNKRPPYPQSSLQLIGTSPSVKATGFPGIGFLYGSLFGSTAEFMI